MSRALSLAGFQVTLIGRIWVTPEEKIVLIKYRVYCLVGPIAHIPNANDVRCQGKAAGG
jgi:hypothetical protein